MALNNDNIDTSIKILDTGKYSTTSSVISGEKIGFGSDGTAGSLLLLKGVEIDVGHTCTNDETSSPNKVKDNVSTESFEYTEVDGTGIEQPLWKISGIFNKKNLDDMKTLGRLTYMTKTKGYKIIYAPLDSERTDMISYSKYGEREAAGESIKTIDSINVRIKSFNIKQASDATLLKWTLNLVETI